METKDLVLLMLIPIILVSLIVYTDKNPVITGAVTAQQQGKEEQSNVIGTYSIMPSFKAKIDYDLNDYNKIKNLLDLVISCARQSSVEQCVAQINDNEFEWQLGCDKGPEKVLYDFAEFLQDCFDSADNNCLCTKDISITKEEIQAYSPRTNQYSFIIDKGASSKKITISSESGDLSQTVNTNGISALMPKRYSLGYSLGRSPEFNLFFYDSADKEIKPGFGPTTQIIIFKNDINNPKSLDFVNQEDENLVYPNGKVVIDKSNNPINSNNLPKCNFKPKNIYRFCVTKKNYKIMAYDKLDTQVKERPVTIKFAAYIPPQQKQ